MSGGPRAAAKGFRSKPYAESAWLWGGRMSGGPGRRPEGFRINHIRITHRQAALWVVWKWPRNL